MAVPQAVKNAVLKIMPGPAESMQRALRRRRQQRFEQNLDLPRIAAAFTEKHGLVVHNGPFKGMRYIPSATGSMFLPKLIGSYEMEITAWVEQLIKRNPTVVIDIGCAEGYYAVGLAQRLPGSHVVAFDSNPHARDLCQQLAKENTVQDKVSVRGLCDFEPFEKLLQESKKDGPVSALVVCDCDGCEALLLDPVKVPSLAESDVLVETHDHIDNTISPTLRKNFAPTHDIVWVPSGDRDPQMHPEVQFLPLDEQEKALNEYRPPQGWLIMTPKSRPLTA